MVLDVQFGTTSCLTAYPLRLLPPPPALLSYFSLSGRTNSNTHRFEITSEMEQVRVDNFFAACSRQQRDFSIENILQNICTTESIALLVEFTSHSSMVEPGIHITVDFSSFFSRFVRQQPRVDAVPRRARHPPRHRGVAVLREVCARAPLPHRLLHAGGESRGRPLQEGGRRRRTQLPPPHPRRGRAARAPGESDKKSPLFLVLFLHSIICMCASRGWGKFLMNSTVDLRLI